MAQARGGLSHTRGYLYGLIANIGFGFTFIAVVLGSESFDPIIMSAGRVIPSAIGAVIALKLFNQKLLPPRGARVLVGGVALGTVIGYPLLTTLALQIVPAGDAGVIGAVVPLVTGIVSVFLGHRRPKAMFWVASVIGTISALLFAFARAEGASGGGEFLGYLALSMAVLFASLGHISGTTLAAKYNPFYVISWAIIISIPVNLTATVIDLVANPITEWPAASAWGGFLFASLFSVLIGNYFWHDAMHTIGLVKASQLALLQPPVTMIFAIVILGQNVTAITWITAAAILASVAWSQRVK
jgi:drug/metabolite transporter (DMT)-like permease